MATLTRSTIQVKFKDILEGPGPPSPFPAYATVADGSTASSTLALPHLNETDVHKYLSSGHQICGSHTGKGLVGCMEDVEVFPSQISEAYPSLDWQYGDGHYHAKG